MKFTEKLFGTHSERELKRIYPIVDKIEALRPTMQALTDEELRAKTKEYKDRYNGGESLDDLLPEAFATVREAAKRVLVWSITVYSSSVVLSPSGTYRRDENR